MSKLNDQGIVTTTNMFSKWQTALLNVGVGARFNILRMLRLRRRLVYRVDGCYSREIFDLQSRPWQSDFDRANSRISVALREACFVIYQSEFAKKYLDTIHARKRGTYEVIPNGVDLEKFIPAPNKDSSLPTIGCIGTFRSNRVKALVDISRHLTTPHRLLLVGRMDEECRRDLAEAIASPQKHCHLDYRSSVTSENMLIKYHRQIDCFLHPVIGDTCSNSVVEALACGVPVIVPRFSGSSSLVGIGGIVVEPDPWVSYRAFTECFAEAIVEILRERETYSLRARARACETLDINVTTEKYINALDLCK